MESTLPRSTIKSLLLGIWIMVLLAPTAITANAQDDPPLPIQVLHTALVHLAYPDTPIFHLDALSFLDADLSKDETVSGMAFTFSETELPGVWIANYAVISEHPTGTGEMDLPLFQSCESRAQIIMVDTREAPSEMRSTPDDDLLNLSLSEAAVSGFSNSEVRQEFQSAGLNADDYVGTRSFHGLDLHFIRVPLYQQALDGDTLEYTDMIQGYRTRMVWGDGDWLFLIRDTSEMIESYNLVVDGQDAGTYQRYQDTCPIDRHPQIDAFQWAETLYQTYSSAGLLSGQVPTPSPAYSASCSLHPEIGKPLILEADFSDGQGGFLKNQPLWITGDGEFGRLVRLDNPGTIGKDWIALQDIGLLVETNPNGRLVLTAAVDINQAIAPISPLTPLTGGLNFSMPGPDGDTIPVGHCEFSINYIAMSNSYGGAIGLDPAGDDFPTYALVELGLSGKPLPPKFQTFTSGDVLIIGSSGITGSPGGSDGSITLEYIDGSAVMIQYILPKVWDVYDHPPFGEYVIGHSTLGPSFSADHSSLFTFGINKLVSEAVELSVRMVVKTGLGPVTGAIVDLAGDYIADQVAPLTFHEKNIQALRVIRLRSQVEISYHHPGGDILVRTFEGNPEILVPESGATLTMVAGQETRPFDQNPVVTDFDLAQADTWWETPEWQAVAYDMGPEQGADPVENLEQVDGRVLIFLGAVCLLVLMGSIAMIVLLLVIRRSKKRALS